MVEQILFSIMDNAFIQFCSFADGAQNWMVCLVAFDGLNQIPVVAGQRIWLELPRVLWTLSGYIFCCRSDSTGDSIPFRTCLCFGS